jgi:hypothetical protein
MLKDAQTPRALLQLLQQHKLQQQGGVLDAINVATAFHCCGRSCQADAAVAGTAAAEQVLQHMEQLLPSVQQQLEPRHVSNIVWACAHAKYIATVSQLLSAFVQHKSLSAANSQDAAIVVRAVGKLGHQVPPHQLAALLTAFTADGVLGTATAQGISNVLLGMAYLGQHLPDAQLELLLAAQAVKSDMAHPQALSNSLWAVAKLEQQVQDSEVLQQLVAAILTNLCRTNTQGIANTLWAVSEMGLHLLPEQTQPMLAAFLKQLRKADPQEISNILLACATFRFVQAPLLAALKQWEHLQRFLAGAEPQALANTAGALATVGQRSGPLLGCLLQQAMVLLEQDSSRFTSQNLVNLCWAVAVLDMPQHSPQLEVLQLARAANMGQAVPELLRQLHQVHLWLQDSTPAAAKGARNLGLLHVLS